MLDSIYPHKEFDPEWTELEYSRGGARDDLGIETLSESILADLLPGINNQTRRARYYSFWAWVLRDFILDSDATHTQQNFYEWLRKRESTLILANLSHGCEGGAAGTTIGGRYWKDGIPKTYPIGWKSLESVNGGAYELYYRGVLLETNVINRNEEDPHDNLTNEIGLPLAEAYQNAVINTNFISHYLDASQLRKDDIEEYSENGCLCQVKKNEAERQALINTLFRYDTPDVFAVKRLATLCLFLDLINQSSKNPLSAYQFRAALYFWVFENHQAYIPEGNLINPAQRWRIFQLRQYFVFAIESLWSLFLNRVQGSILSEEEYIEWLLSEFDFNALVQEFDLDVPTTDPSQITLLAFFQSIQKAVSLDASLSDNGGLEIPLNEYALSEYIRRERSKTDVNVYFGKGLLMLALIYWRCQPWQELPGWRYVSDAYAADRMPLDSFLRHVTDAINQNWTLKQWTTWFHCRYLWLQHRRVTLEKLIARQSKQETSKFEIVYNESDATPLFKGIDVDSPKMNAPRFPSAISILIDLGLVEKEENAYWLTPDGIDLLNQFSSYTLPEWKEPESDETDLDSEESTSG